MNLSILWRVIWKEYRLQRPLWLVVFGLAVLVDCLTLWCDPLPFYKMIILYYIALITPALYVLGSGATLFAGEHEAETYEFQRSLPVAAMSILVGKVVLVMVSAAAMWAVMVFLVRLLTPAPLLAQGSGVPWRMLAWATIGFFTVELFVWAVLFSLLTKRVLVAAILGVSAASLGSHLAGATVTWNIVMETYMQAMPWRMGIVAVVALADVWLAARWVREKRVKQPRGVPASAIEKLQHAGAIGDRLLGPQRLAILGRLVWQHWRQSRRMSLIITLLFLPLVAISTALLARVRGYPVWFIEAHAGEIYVPVDKLFFSIQVTLALATVPMFGIGAFLADQRRSSHRFLADRGVPPKFVWLSRQLVTLGIPMLAFVSLLLGLFFLAMAMLPAPVMSDLPRWTNLSLVYGGVYTLLYLLLSVLGYVFLGIAVGQLCSMFIRSPLLAGLFSVLLTIVLVNWCALMFFWHVNWLWSILPIPLALLLATRLHTADWLAERGGLRAWLRPGLALLIPAVALLIAVPLYRIYSIPIVDPGFSPDEFSQPLTPEEQATFGLYTSAMPVRAPLRYGGTAFMEHPGANALTSEEVAWVHMNPERIAMAEKASRGKIHNCPTGTLLPKRGDLLQLARLLLCSAVVREEKGELDAALNQYLAALQLASYLRNWYPISVIWHERFDELERGAEMIEAHVYARLPRWATRKGQTPERILATVRRLEELTSKVPSNNGVKLAYFQLRRFFSGNPKSIRGCGAAQPLPVLTVFWLRLPWERARAERLLNVLTRCQLDDLSQVEEGVRRGEAFRSLACGANAISHLLGRETESSYALQAEIVVPPIEYDSKWGSVRLVEDYLALVAEQRAARIVLAIETWKLKHGSLPKKLDELVGHGLDQLPADPYSGRPFHYFRDGLKIPLQWNQLRLLTAHMPSTAFAYNRGTIAANAPFLWASGSKLLCVVTRYGDTSGQRFVAEGGNVVDQYEIFTRVRNSIDEWRRPDSEYDVWESGWPFPIP